MYDEYGRELALKQQTEEGKMGETKPRRVRVEFRVLFSSCDHIYSLAGFLTWGAAVRYVKYRFGSWSYQHDLCVPTGWAIERHIVITGGTGDSFYFRLHRSSCVLQQSRNFSKGWHNMRRENMLDDKLPFRLNRRRFPRWSDIE